MLSQYFVHDNDGVTIQTHSSNNRVPEQRSCAHFHAQIGSLSVCDVSIGYDHIWRHVWRRLPKSEISVDLHWRGGKRDLRSHWLRSSSGFYRQKEQMWRLNCMLHHSSSSADPWIYCFQCLAWVLFPCITKEFRLAIWEQGAVRSLPSGFPSEVTKQFLFDKTDRKREVFGSSKFSLYNGSSSVEKAVIELSLMRKNTDMCGHVHTESRPNGSALIPALWRTVWGWGPAHPLQHGCCFL